MDHFHMMSDVVRIVCGGDVGNCLRGDFAPLRLMAQAPSDLLGTCPNGSFRISAAAFAPPSTHSPRPAPSFRASQTTRVPPIAPAPRPRPRVWRGRAGEGQLSGESCMTIPAKVLHPSAVMDRCPRKSCMFSGKERPVIDRNSSSDHGQIMSPWTGPKA